MHTFNDDSMMTISVNLAPVIVYAFVSEVRAKVVQYILAQSRRGHIKACLTGQEL